MSRSGYTEDCESINLYRNSVHRALTGKRGQAFLRELRDALDAMPEKRLITGALVSEALPHPHTEPGCCAMGAVALARGVDTSKLDPEDRDMIAAAFGIAPSMAAEIAYENDEHDYYRSKSETPEERWTRMRAWAEKYLRP